VESDFHQRSIRQKSDKPKMPEFKDHSWEARLLKFLLLLGGTILLTAAFAVFLPVGWMKTGHEWLGLGEFPDRPITAYLARSTSLLYAVHGSLMVYTGLTLRLHWRFVPLFGWLHVVIGLVMLGTDITAPMPWYWTIAEGGPVAGLGVLMLWLYNRAFGRGGDRDSGTNPG
jgi:hypothetical protein